jgi:hypothetical protein
MKDLSTNTILQDVAVNGSNVGGEHAPEHALNIGVPMRVEPVESGVKGAPLGNNNALLRTRAHR